MTNQIALTLGILIVGLIAADLLFAEGGSLLFLSKKFLEFTEWIAFWR
ncbi:hypothetical protein SAMN05444851_1275 [Aliiroseovarius sediminilitoris]|uniref:Uncharacterized protein n=1 Tax=Aliiroseovarius sediminilitoris TaxID=1173584 RepID=A0A1I0P1E9_9RHOB|nr:hypothetical protein [Aliiroseovarius sediminilitoris]SEW07994.1 hypothetical protein SAMN05444851_1275 [Aliiroseovarius sediminilitoris]